MNARLILALLCLLLVGNSCKTPKSAQTASTNNKRLNVVPPGLLQFEAESLSYKALGGFHRWQFTKLNIPKNKEGNLEGLTATVEVDITSVYERTIRLTNDLKSEKYLDADFHPRAYIQIFDVKPIEKNLYVCKMTLTLKGFSKTFYSEFEVTNKEPFHVKGTADVLRSDFNIQEGELGIPNDIHIVYDTDLDYSQTES